MSVRWCRLACLALALPTLFASAARCDEDLLLVAEQATGIVALDGHTRVDVRGFKGSLLIRGGGDGQMRFGGRAIEDREEERPIAVWHDGKTFTIRPRAGDENAEIFVELAVPAALGCVVEMQGGRVASSAIRGGFVLRGANLEVDLRAMLSDVDLRLTDSKVVFNGTSDAVTVHGRGIDLDLRRVEGPVVLDLEGGQVRLAELGEGASIDLTGTALEGTAVQGGLDVRADEGSVRINGLTGPGRFGLNQTALDLRGSTGPVEVETDAAVEFHDLGGKVQIRSFGGAIRGGGTSGELQIETGGNEVELVDLGGTTRISGDTLLLQVRKNTGALTVKTTGSEIRIEESTAPVDVDNDFGDIVVNQASQPLRIVSRNGAVRISALHAALELRADGPQVEVDWLSLGNDKNSYVENQSGDVRLSFGAAASGRIEAEAANGIDSDLPRVEVNDDGRSASGQIGRTSRPLVKVKSGGNLQLAGAVAQAEG